MRKFSGSFLYFFVLLLAFCCGQSFIIIISNIRIIALITVSLIRTLLILYFLYVFVYLYPMPREMRKVLNFICRSCCVKVQRTFARALDKCNYFAFIKLSMEEEEEVGEAESRLHVCCVHKVLMMMSISIS